MLTQVGRAQRGCLVRAFKPLDDERADGSRDRKDLQCRLPEIDRSSCTIAKPSIFPVKKRLAPSIKSAILLAEKGVMFSLLIVFRAIVGAAIVAITSGRSAGPIIRQFNLPMTPMKARKLAGTFRRPSFRRSGAATIVLAFAGLGSRRLQTVTVIDDDLGCSGSCNIKRLGFEQFPTIICLGDFCAVYCTETSRRSRTGALVIDPEGAYDPRLLNDRPLREPYPRSCAG
jgi:hypothetical protein